MNDYQIYYLLGNILMLDHHPEQRDLVVHQLHKSKLPPNLFIKVANWHWLLQALYPRIIRHQLEEYLSAELLSYLKMVAELNEQRTEALLEQMREITRLMNDSGIEPIFLKGSGHLIDQLYSHPADRIMLDIDFMVPDEVLEKAAGILLHHGYYQKREYDAEYKHQIKHYPRLHKKGAAAPVEIHRTLVGNKYSEALDVMKVSNELVRPAALTGCYVLSDNHKLLHNFIHSQLEHNGHRLAQFSLRNLYDFYLVARRCDPVALFQALPFYKRQSAGYFAACDKTFGTTYLDRYGYKRAGKIYLLRFNTNLRFRWIVLTRSVYFRITHSYIKKPIRAIYDRRLRRHLVKNLMSRRWYKKHLRKYKNIFMTGRN